MFTCGNGCNGGYPSGAWSYWCQSGIVTGDLYDGTGCQPYTLKPCDHHVTGKLSPCPSTLDPTPACQDSCQSSYKTAFAQDKHYGKTSYSVSSDVAKIQTEIMTNGPVEGSFTVYEDFLAYKSGVYKHVTG